jgi:hypothetical protein
MGYYTDLNWNVKFKSVKDYNEFHKEMDELLDYKIREDCPIGVKGYYDIEPQKSGEVER